MDKLRLEFEAGDPEAVVSHFDVVLRASPFPGSFTRGFRLAYVPESRQLVVEFELSPLPVIPPTKAYNYVKTKEEVTKTQRPQRRLRSVNGPLYDQAVQMLVSRGLYSRLCWSATGSTRR